MVILAKIALMHWKMRLVGILTRITAAIKKLAGTLAEVAVFQCQNT